MGTSNFRRQVLLRAAKKRQRELDEAIALAESATSEDDLGGALKTLSKLVVDPTPSEMKDKRKAAKAAAKSEVAHYKEQLKRHQRRRDGHDAAAITKWALPVVREMKKHFHDLAKADDLTSEDIGLYFQDHPEAGKLGDALNIKWTVAEVTALVVGARKQKKGSRYGVPNLQKPSEWLTEKLARAARMGEGRLRQLRYSKK